MIDPELDFRRLKSAVTLECLLHSRGLLQPMRRRGRRLFGCCPVHGGDNPTAFVIDLPRQVWYCFSRCGAGGDVVDLVRCMDQVGYTEAAIELARIAGTGPMWMPTETAPQHRRKPSRQSFRPFVRRLDLDPHVELFETKGIRPETAMAFEAGQWHHRGFLHGCVGVRLHDPHGHPLGYAGRRLDPAAAERYGKWKVPRGLPKATVLFNHHRVKHRLPSGVFVVECPWGVMRLTQVGIPAVALLGTALNPTQRELLAVARRVVLMMDGDAAGYAAAERIRAALAKQVEVITWRLPQGADPDDLPDSLLGPWASSFLGRRIPDGTALRQQAP